MERQTQEPDGMMGSAVREAFLFLAARHIAGPWLPCPVCVDMQPTSREAISAVHFGVRGYPQQAGGGPEDSLCGPFS